MRRAKSGLLFVLTLLLLVVGVACPDSNPVLSGNGSITMAVSNHNPGRWGYATFSVDRVTFRPLDPEADNRLGPRLFLLSPDSIVIESSTPEVDPASFTTIPLAPGTYQIYELFLGSIYFDQLNYPGSLTDCEIMFTYNDATLNITTPLTFTVDPNSDGTVHFTFDVAAFGEAIENAYINNANFFPPPFCEGDIDTTMVAASIGTFLTLD